MSATLFVLLRERDKAVCRERAEAALREWGAAWMPPASHAIDCAAACDFKHVPPAAKGWTMRRFDDGGLAWLHVGAGFERQLERTLFSVGDTPATVERHRESPLGASITGEALDDLGDRLLRHVGGAGSQAAGHEQAALDACFRYGAGAAVISVGIADKQLHLVVPAARLNLAAAVERRPTAPRTGLAQAVRDMPVTLRVEAGEAEVTIGQLRMLALGDVIPLAARIDLPLRVTGPGGATVCLGHVGTLQGARAVELKSIPKRKAS